MGHCHWLTMDNPDGTKTTVHLNMSGPRRRKCAHCDCKDAKTLCDWRMLKPTRLQRYDEIREGELLVQADGWQARVDTLVPHGTPKFGGIGTVEYLTVHATVLNLGSFLPKRTKVPFKTAFTLSPGTYNRFRVMRPGTCDKPCCFRCRRHVDRDVDYCKDHWAPGAEQAAAEEPARSSAVQESLF